MLVWIGIDIGGTKTALYMVDSTNSILWEAKRPTRFGHELIPYLRFLIDEALQGTKLSQGDLKGIGIGVPGQIDTATGDVSLAVNLLIDQPIPLGRSIAAAFDTPTFVENDVHLATIGVQHRFALDSAVYVSVGTGVAAGFIFNNQLHRGAHNLAGEIGQVIEAYEDGQPMALEQVIAGPAIVRQASAIGIHVDKPSDLFQLAANGSAKARLMTKHVISHLVRTIQWLVFATWGVDLEWLIWQSGGEIPRPIGVKSPV